MARLVPRERVVRLDPRETLVLPDPPDLLDLPALRQAYRNNLNNLRYERRFIK